MSKGQGKRIGIKFTQELVGDVSGNQSAFTITGKEYKYVNGNLIDKVYTVDKVERYPIPVLYEDNFQGGTADGVEIANAVKLAGADFNLSLDGVDDYIAIPDSDSLRLTSRFTLEAKVRINAINIGEQYVFWKFTGGAQYSTSYGIRLNNNVWLTRVTKSGTQTSATGTSTPAVGEWYHISAVYDGSSLRLYVNGVQEAQASISGTLDMGAYPLNIGKRENSAGAYDGFLNGDVKDVRVWNIARTQQQIQDNMNIELVGNESGLIGYWRLNTGTGTTAIDSTGNNNGTIHGATWEGLGYSAEPATYINSVDISTLSSNTRLNWTADTPEGTSITVEYAVNETEPTELTPIENGGIITIPQTEGYFLWLKYTLQTTDTTVTPTLSRVWLEEASAPQDKLLLTCNVLSRFPTVEGALTVSYDASKGNLVGAGGAVESFETTFTPIDLVPEPNPHVIETITAQPIITVTIYDIDYIHGYATETLTASPANVTVVITDVGIIDP